MTVRKFLGKEGRTTIWTIVIKRTEKTGKLNKKIFFSLIR